MIVIEQNGQVFIAAVAYNDRVGSVIAKNVRSASVQSHTPYFVAYGPEAEKMTFYGTFRVMELKS